MALQTQGIGIIPGRVDKGTNLTTKGDIHTFSTQQTRLPVGTDGQVLTADSSQATGLKWAGASSNLTLVEERIITTASQTEDFTGLDGDADGCYILEGRLVNDAGSGSNYSPRMNGSATAQNRQILSVESTSVGGGADTSGTFCGASSGAVTTFRAEIPVTKTGYQRNMLCNAAHLSSGSLAIFLSYLTITTPSNATNITSIGIGASVADGIGVGSVIRLWKVSYS